MSQEKKDIVVSDRRDFRYEVEIKFFQHQGFAMAYYKGQPIADVTYSKLLPPASDNDAEWESYEERLMEWQSDAEIDLIPKCKEHFNNKRYE